MSPWSETFTFHKNPDDNSPSPPPGRDFSPTSSTECSSQEGNEKGTRGTDPQGTRKGSLPGTKWEDSEHIESREVTPSPCPPTTIPPHPTRVHSRSRRCRDDTLEVSTEVEVHGVRGVVFTTENS